MCHWIFCAPGLPTFLQGKVLLGMGAEGISCPKRINARAQWLTLLEMSWTPHKSGSRRSCLALCQTTC